MCLPEILALEAFRNLVNDRHNNEVKQDVEDHVAPVAGLGVRGSNSENYNEQKAKGNKPITHKIIHEDLSSVIFHHGRCQVDSVLKFSESHLFFWEGTTLESLFGVGTFVSWLNLRVSDVHEVWVLILGDIVHLLRFCPHEGVSCWNLTKVKNWHTCSGEDVFVRVF